MCNTSSRGTGETLSPTKLKMLVVRPQRGPQEQFLASPADLVIYGGGAGGGKTWALLLEATRHSGVKDFGAVIFRRNSTQIRNEGGLWDESEKLFLPLGAQPLESRLDWNFPSGAAVSFRHLEYEKNKHDWQGAQICLLCFDELTHFTQGQFWYLVSRNRSTCGVRPYIRATCNPDPDSWVALLIAWWIDQDTGLPIPSRVGVLRYFVRVGETIMWADRPEDLAQYTMINELGVSVPIPPMSMTFIPALVTDNAALMQTNPQYVANLMALPTVQRERLMGGNWKIRQSGGMFKRGDVKIVDAAPPIVRKVRAWDLAATGLDEEGASSSATAATSGVLMGETETGDYIILDVERDWLSPSGVLRRIKNVASQDGRGVYGSLPQDPGQAGKSQVQFWIKELAGYNYHGSPESGDKVTRAQPLLAQWEAGNVHLLRGPWNDAFLSEMESFPEGKLKDQADAASRAFNELIGLKKKPVVISRRRFG